MGVVIHLGHAEPRELAIERSSKVSLIRRSDRCKKECQSRRKFRLPFGVRCGSALGVFLGILVLGSVIGTLAIPLAFSAEPRKGLGMWVWSNTSFLTEEARLQLVQFCIKHRITHLDVHARMRYDSTKVILKDAEAFKALIALAGRYKITTAALRGNPKMFFSENHEQTLQELRAIVAFSETLPQDALFKGIKYDVEPYCTREWKTEGTPLYPMMHDYLTLLRKARSVLDEEAPHLWLAADTPFWWDKDKFILEFEGKRKRFNEHIQDLTDFITIMSYRRSSRKVLDCVEEERRYAQQIRKIIFPSLETSKLKQDPHVSFWGAANEELWNVVPELLDAAERDPAIGGIMIHCYRSLREKLSDDSPRAPQQVTPE